MASFYEQLRLMLERECVNPGCEHDELMCRECVEDSPYEWVNDDGQAT